MFELGTGEQSELLGLARRTVEHAFQTCSFLSYYPQHSSLQTLAGAFVSLHHGEDLRGCIGHLKADRPLYRAVMESALAAAFQDPRFPPLQEEELRGLAIEISVLSLFIRVEDIDEVEVGRDGLVISLGSRRGLLLPQVAVRYGWDRARFLEETCLKAGLPRYGWRAGATIEKFSAQVFGENHASL